MTGTARSDRSARSRAIFRRCRALAGAAAALAALALSSGCSTLAYYGQAAAGHLDLLRRAQPIDTLVADPATPAALRERLQLAQRLRRFAVTELALPDNASYTRYADLGRPAAVWNVVAAPELSLTLKTWCYPVLGCAGYRGYFNRADADAEAAALRAQGLDVLVYAVPAYSTLGWSNAFGGDPLLNTFVNGSASALAQLVFHELSHQQVYAAGDTTFNESYATAVQRLGWARWRETTGTPPDDPDLQRRRDDFRALTAKTRAALDALYRSAASDDAKRRGKAELLATLRADHAALKAGAWHGYSGWDGWFADVNNAAIGVQAAYDALVPGFERLFAANGHDFARFHAAVRALAAASADERRRALQNSLTR